MEKPVEGAHTCFLRQITGNWARQNTGITWVTPAAGAMHEAAGTQLVATYIGLSQGTVAQ